jgi:hypothetical protein
MSLLNTLEMDFMLQRAKQPNVFKWKFQWQKRPIIFHLLTVFRIYMAVVAGYEFLKNVSKIWKPREVVKILAIGYIHHARQLCRLELKLRNKSGRGCKVRKTVSDFRVYLSLFNLVLEFYTPIFQWKYHSHRSLNYFLSLEKYFQLLLMIN